MPWQVQAHLNFIENEIIVFTLNFRYETHSIRLRINTPITPIPEGIQYYPTINFISVILRDGRYRPETMLNTNSMIELNEFIAAHQDELPPLRDFYQPNYLISQGRNGYVYQHRGQITPQLITNVVNRTLDALEEEENSYLGANALRSIGNAQDYMDGGRPRRRRRARSSRRHGRSRRSALRHR